MKKRKFQIYETEKSSPLGPWLSGKLRIDLVEAEKLISMGAVYVDGRRCQDAKTKLRTGAAVIAVLEEGGRPSLNRAAEPQTLEVLHEDSAIVAINKASGIPTQPTPSGREVSLFQMVSSRYRLPKSGLVHRLDRETSGAILFARTAAAARDLAEQFRRGRVNKHYLAIVTAPIPDAGMINLKISRDPSRTGRRRASRSDDGLGARTNYRVLYRAEDFSVLDVDPRTGRTHQIRVHLSAIGAPILGDRLYGGEASAAGHPAKRCLLHSRSLVFVHPATDATVRIVAPIPDDMKSFLQDLPEGSL